MTTVLNGNIPIESLERVRDRETLFAFLHEQLGWPLDPEDTFTYPGPPVPGERAVRVEVTRLVPFTAQDPFVIMLAQFETDFRRTDLREILRNIRKEMRTRDAYQGKGLEEVIFLCATHGYQGLRFAHFREQEGRQPKLSVFGWERDNLAATRTLCGVNLPALRLPINLFDEMLWTDKTRHAWLSAWDVEAVTARFFIDFHDTFKEVKRRIAAASPALADHDLHTFTLTLMNRLLFCWFIQQKKWLAHDPAFLSHFWEHLHIDHRKKKDIHGDAFYADYLRPLFLKVLNVPPPEREAEIKEMIGESRGDCMIPYLNGGLFEENALDRRADPENAQRQIIVPNIAIELLISNGNRVQTTPGLFQRWNFTVQESTPLDVDVAVDPEMLGKVFEELMNEVTGAGGDTKRHETGAYYTPRPIVSFMCKEALKGYLAGVSDTPAEIECFVDNYDADGIRDPEAVLAHLQRVKACDPACGSGAYLLGLLQELLHLRRALFASSRVDPLNDYRRKLEIIQTSLYGVDLEPSAVEIARLRLWLSLVVDFDDGGDLTRVPALPNLDFKIEQGDSLAPPDPLTWKKDVQQGFRRNMVEQFDAAKRQYADPLYRGNKTALLEMIKELRKALSQWTHPGSDVMIFDWAVDFAEVFEESEPERTLDGRFAFVNQIEQQQTFLDPEIVRLVRGGFDIVLANPPYVRQELIRDQKPSLKHIYGELFCGTADIYVFFYYRALQLLKRDGMLVFISSNKWLRAGYGAKLRAHIARTARVSSITDFGDLPVFQTALTYPMIIVAQKGSRRTMTRFTEVGSLVDPYPDVRMLIDQQGYALAEDALSGENWRLTDAGTVSFLKKMESSGRTLGEYLQRQIFYGIKTGFNTAFVIDSTKRAELIAADSKSAEIIKPLIMGRDIRKWTIDRNEHWLIVTPIGINIKHYPAVFAHLGQWQQELETRYDKGKYWWELRACDYYGLFAQRKIIYQEIATYQAFALDTEGAMTNNKVFMIPSDDLYLLGVLNSATAWRYFDNTCSKLQGGAFAMQMPYISKLPIPEATETERAAIADLVQKCLDANGIGCKVWEAEINERVTKLYGV